MAIKKLALSALALAAAGAAQAQSSVTIYGVADAFLQVANGDDTLTRLQSGGLNGSRLGFRGVEDLGGGLRAVFTLEHGINLDEGSTGQGGTMWGRQAFVGLGSSTAGTLTLGRQYSSLYHISGDFSAFTNGSYGASTAVIGGFGGYEPVRGGGSSAGFSGGPARVNNSIKYETPSFSGLRVGALWGFGENTAGVNKTRVGDIWARYTAGPLDAMISYVDDKNEDALKARTTTVAAAYSFGSARVMAGYLHFNDGTSANLDGKGAWLGGDYRFGNHLVRAQYVLSNPKGDDNDTQAFGVGYQYDLSKRTALYTSLTQFRNDNGVAGATATRWHSGVPTGLTTASDNDITEFVVGVRHTF
ncbi:MAG TPA: porin [Burkholderiaceae bacterium]|nr:porin [Burkholderiaceae bacterium]